MEEPSGGGGGGAGGAWCWKCQLLDPVEPGVVAWCWSWRLRSFCMSELVDELCGGGGPGQWTKWGLVVELVKLWRIWQS